MEHVLVVLARRHLGQDRIAMCQLMVQLYRLMKTERMFSSGAAKTEVPDASLRICLPTLQLLQYFCEWQAVEWQAVEFGEPTPGLVHSDEGKVGDLMEEAELRWEVQLRPSE